MKTSEEIKANYFEYTKRFDSQKPKMNRKIWHSTRVAENSKKIAESLDLSKEQVNIAEIIGLLHDLGKLEQIENGEYKKIEHGKLAVEILKKDNYIRRYIETNKYDNIIFKAIENHGLFKIKEGLTEEELLFAKIVRDADKLDIFYEATVMFWNESKQKEEIEGSEVSDNYLEEFKSYKAISRKNGEKKNSVDGVVSILSFIFDINFLYDFEILQKEDYINKILNKFEFKSNKAKMQIEEIRMVANNYIDENNITKQRI